MKKLQNNFTTPEQSKKLLELGVPADSADQVYFDDVMWCAHEFIHNDITYSEFVAGLENLCLPCWSVGRLMEIIAACYLSTVEVNFQHRENMCDALLEFIEESVKYGEIDFSKLEE